MTDENGEGRVHDIRNAEKPDTLFNLMFRLKDLHGQLSEQGLDTAALQTIEDAAAIFSDVWVHQNRIPGKRPQKARDLYNYLSDDRYSFNFKLTYGMLAAIYWVRNDMVDCSEREKRAAFYEWIIEEFNLSDRTARRRIDEMFVRPEGPYKEDLELGFDDYDFFVKLINDYELTNRHQ